MGHVLDILCLDLEGVLVPEVWQAVARETQLPELLKTTRDIPVYEDLMDYRLDILHKQGITLTNIQNEIIISYAPFLSQKTGELERNNTYSNIHVGFSYYFNKDVSMEYMFDYENDQFRSDTYDIKPFNLTQTFRIRYNFDL